MGKRVNKAKEERPLTLDEKVEGVSNGLAQLGAIYKSHNAINLYIEVPKGAILDDDNLKKKAKQTIMMYTGLILRII